MLTVSNVKIKRKNYKHKTLLYNILIKEWLGIVAVHLIYQTDLFKKNNLERSGQIKVSNLWQILQGWRGKPQT